MRTLFVPLVVGLALISVFLPRTGWLTEEGIKIVPWVMIPIQVLAISLYVYLEYKDRNRVKSK